MLERESALAAVSEVLTAARAGRGRALFVIGEAGLGKTTILTAATGQAGDQFRVGSGRGGFGRAAVPFGLVAEALGPLAGDGVVEDELMKPSRGSGSPASVRLYVTFMLIRQLAASAPLLLTFDDLHAADPDSLGLIHLLCHRIARLPVAVIATCRPWPEPALLVAEDPAAGGVADVQRLAPLSPVAARSLVADRVGDNVPDAVLDQTLAACGGNPLLLGYAADDLRRGDDAGSPATQSKIRMMLFRLIGANEDDRQLLRAASVLGLRFRIAVAGKVAGLPDRRAITALDRLTRTGLISGGDGGWAQFSHELVRQAVYEELAPPVRAQLHELAFRALVAYSPNPAEAAGQALAAGLTGDTQAITTLARAGRDALRAGAVKAARRDLEAAVQLAGGAVADDTYIDLGRALLLDGDSSRAAEVCERALRSARLDAATRAGALGLIGRAAFHVGDFGRAQACYASAAALTEGQHPELAVGALLDEAFLTWAYLGPGAALPLAERSRALAAGAGTKTAGALRACADAAWALCAYLTGDPHGLGVAQLAAGLAGAAALSASAGANWALEPTAIFGDLAVWAERFPDAELLLTQALTEAERGGEPFLDFHASLSWSDGLRRLGRLGEALALADRAVEVARLMPVGLPLALSARGLALADLGRIDEAAKAHAEVREAAGDGPGWYLATGYELHLVGALAYRRGDPGAACAAFGRLRTLLSDRAVADACHIDYAQDAIDAYLGCGRLDGAGALIEWLESGSPSLPGRWPGLVAAVGRARLADAGGNPGLAATRFADVVAEPDGLPQPLARAWALTHYGAFLARHGQQARSRGMLAGAAELAEDCGAAWHAAWARAEWRRAGGRRRTAPDELTPQEAAVARLARAGRTNREIAQQLYLSVNTVETHMRHIFRKLGIERRWQLLDHPGPGSQGSGDVSG